MPTSLSIGTRIHLGKASTPPTDESLTKILTAFYDLVVKTGAVKGVIAVDGDDTKISEYSLKGRLSILLQDVVHQYHTVEFEDIADSKSAAEEPNKSSNKDARTPVTILPVVPWGNFIPALNAIVTWSASSDQYPPSASHLLLISAETALTVENVKTLVEQCSLNDTLVAGAVLPGHDFRGGGTNETKEPIEVPLTGRTTPWNTAAVWNVPQLALTGFPLVAEGVHRTIIKETFKLDSTNTPKDKTTEDQIECAVERTVPVSPGVEEVATIALQQSVWNKESVKAKLVPLSNIEWNQTWTDETRQKWHDAKMTSKVERAGVHLDLIFGSRAKCEATVLHY